jgi:hypothetical protein
VAQKLALAAHRVEAARVRIVTHSTVAIAILGLLTALLGFTAALRWSRWRVSSLARHRARRGVAGQAAAARLLTKAGFTVLDDQPRHSWSATQDGEPHLIELRADYLVERRGLRYVAEVKTGAVVDSLSHPATRRQLLEYQLAFAVDGVLLVCPDRRAIHHIEFAARATRTPARWPLALAGLAIGAAIGWTAALELLAAR